MSYKVFDEYNKFTNCNRMNLVGDSKIKIPVFSGLAFKNPYPVKNNDMRILPPANTYSIDYKTLGRERR